MSIAAAGLAMAINSMNGDPADTRVKIRPVRPPDLYLADERIRINTGTRVVTVDRAPVQISPTPKSLLAYLAFHVDKPRTNAQILSDVWGMALPEDSDEWYRAINLIEQNLRRVRRALGDELGDSFNGAIIWIRNAGYCALSAFS